MRITLSVRVTVLLDDKLVEKVRLKQAKLIQKSRKAVSFSRVLNMAVEAGLKNGRFE
jgi:hypothetical protein